tara:strand:- start:165994 stop:167520 length:1527 start_codon:yes stop_codon:yes gene_type:complete
MTKSTHQTLKLALILTLSVLLQGCSGIQHPSEDHATKHIGLPAQFSEVQLGSASSVDIADGWLASFNDPILESLVQEAWDHNPDLYIAASRYQEAAASLRFAASYLYPELNGGAGARYQYNDGDSDTDRYTGSLDVSWELDLWGRLRSDRAFARSVTEASGLEYLQARHSIAAAVAQGYYGVISARSQLAINQQLYDAERFTAETTLQRVDAGLGTSLDADLAESSIRLAEAAVQDNLASIRESQRGIELLLGRYPSAEIDTASEVLPTIDGGAFAVGVPTALIERRPDIRGAERRVDAAFYDVESAKAAKLPQLTLSADATAMLDPAELVSSIAADLFAPILQGGRLDAQEEAANARQHQAIGNFASVALQAFREVESALSNSKALEKREILLDDASKRLQRASDSAISRYDQGLMTILDLQQIRRQDFETRSLLLAVRYEQVVQRLNLYLALGGPVVGNQPTDGSKPTQLEEQDVNEMMNNELHVGIQHTENERSGTDSETQHGDE